MRRIILFSLLIILPILYLPAETTDTSAVPLTETLILKNRSETVVLVNVEDSAALTSADAETGIRLTLTGSGKLTLENGSRTAKLNFFIGPEPENVNIYETTAGFIPKRIRITGNCDLYSAALTENGDILSPRQADIGHIIFSAFTPPEDRSWDLYRWNLLPETLIFDTADYDVQAKFFKRLAFFVEKPGFVGTLVSDENLEGRHGWNAHDYKADDLAAFFSKAERDQFGLNDEELLLKEILLKNGVILREEGGYGEGRGVVLSVSRETLPNWRYRFLTHECLHSIFFTSEDYRNDIDEVFSGLNPDETEFWKKLLDYRGYDVKNRYLLVNEFMAYMLQQPEQEAVDYFKTFMYKRLTAARPRERAFVDSFETENSETFRTTSRKLGRVLHEYTGREAGQLANLYPADLPQSFFDLFPLAY